MQKAVFTAVLVLSTTSSALAEGPQGQVMAPQGQQQPYYQQQPAPVEEQTAEQGRGIQYGAHVLFPFYVTNPIATADVDYGDGVPVPSDIYAGFGLGIQGRVGWEFGYGFSAEVNLGILFNLLTAESFDGFDSGSVDAVLTTFWVGAGLRYAFLNPSAFVPFLGAGVSLNFWDLCADDEAVCETNVIGVVPNAVVGFAFEISPWAAIEAGLQANLAIGASEAFSDDADLEVYLTPFAGGTLYYD
jgi:opacity protein-like surface antigen